jgi:hypothetical protein
VGGDWYFPCSQNFDFVRGEEYNKTVMKLRKSCALLPNHQIQNAYSLVPYYSISTTCLDNFQEQSQFKIIFMPEVVAISLSSAWFKYQMKYR